MPVVIPLQEGAVVQLTMASTLAGQRILNTFRYKCIVDFAPTVIDYRVALAAMADAIDLVGGMRDKYTAACPTNMILDYYTIQPIWPLRQRYEKYFMGFNGMATLGSTNTANTAVSIRRVTDIIGNKGIGRVQVPACTDGVVAGKVEAVYRATDLSPLADQMKLNIVTATPPLEWQPVLFSITGGVTSTSVVVETSVEDTARVMRRRTVHLGI